MTHDQNGFYAMLYVGKLFSGTKGPISFVLCMQYWGNGANKVCLNDGPRLILTLYNLAFRTQCQVSTTGSYFPLVLQIETTLS